jgi:tetratricopeptide (TPR) repeat protein
MLSFGAFGGFVNYQIEKNKDIQNSSWIRYITMGIAASFLVPLFLNMISSNLLSNIFNNCTPSETNPCAIKPENYFILVGFCMVAAIFSKQFIDSIAQRALKISEKAEKKAEIAEKSSKQASKHSAALATASALVEDKKYDRAIKIISAIINDDPEFPVAHAYLAFIYKREKKYKEAVDSMEKAVYLLNKEDAVWLYNLACYYCLNNESVEKVMETLIKAKSVANIGQMQIIRESITKPEEDFKKIEKNPVFTKFLKEIDN